MISDRIFPIFQKDQQIQLNSLTNAQMSYYGLKSEVKPRSPKWESISLAAEQHTTDI